MAPLESDASLDLKVIAEFCAPRPIVFPCEPGLRTLGRDLAYPRSELGEKILRNDLGYLLSLYQPPALRDKAPSSSLKNYIEEAFLLVNEGYQNAIEYGDPAQPVFISFTRKDAELRLGFLSNPERGFSADRILIRDTSGPRTLLKRGWGFTLMNQLSHGALSLHPSEICDFILNFPLAYVDKEADAAAQRYFAQSLYNSLSEKAA